jgi:LCP family protein required for cell wall assembly
MREIGRKKMHNYDKIEINAPAKDESGRAIDTIDATGRVIKYNGVSYAFNENVVSIAFIGTDEGTDKNEGKEMGDAIYVLAVDAKTGSTKILGISRDTMSDVDVYSDEGKFIDTEKLQMTYAYSFKGTNVTGGQNTLTTISRLFYGLPINDYFAINLNALKTLNDAIGGVTLTSSMTFKSPEDGRTILEGETVTLHGAEAERYVRSRDIEELESNNDRMARQQEYIRAFIASIFPAAKKDISVVSNLYGAIKENSDSTLDITKLTYIASMALSHMKSASDIEYINLSGKIVEGKNAEMYVSNEDAIKTMLDVFYTPMQGTENAE